MLVIALRQALKDSEREGLVAIEVERGLQVAVYMPPGPQVLLVLEPPARRICRLANVRPTQGCTEDPVDARKAREASAVRAQGHLHWSDQCLR